MAARRPILLALLAIAPVAAGCRDAEQRVAVPERPAARAEVPDTRPARCAVGRRPAYFVPGPADGPLAVLGCARLGVSGKPVEFSGNLAHIVGDRHACLNPAYGAGARRGIFIPSLCADRPPLTRFAVRSASRPHQGVRGYGYVIWGTAGAARRVMAGGTRAAVIRVRRKLARRLGERPFRLFVVELPLAAACEAVAITSDRPGAAARIPPRRSICRLHHDSTSPARAAGSASAK